MLNNLFAPNKSIVSISKLFLEFEKMGVRDIQLCLFESYLSGRTQQVRIGNNLSGESPLNFGVPRVIFWVLPYFYVT